MDWTTIVPALIGVLGGGGIVAVINAVAGRQKLQADTTKVFTDSMKELLSEYRQQNDELQNKIAKLQDRIQHLEKEQEVQALHIENTNTAVMKMKIVNTITVMQLRSVGIEPLIPPERVDSITLDELRLMAESFSNVEQRRQDAMTRKAQRTGRQTGD